jgi:hypothetical protein
MTVRRKPKSDSPLEKPPPDAKSKTDGDTADPEPPAPVKPAVNDPKVEPPPSPPPPRPAEDLHPPKRKRRSPSAPKKKGGWHFGSFHI